MSMEFSPKIDTGNILTIIFMIVALGIAWGNLGPTLSGLKDGQMRVETQVAAAQVKTDKSIADSKEDLRQAIDALSIEVRTDHDQLIRIGERTRTPAPYESNPRVTRNVAPQN